MPVHDAGVALVRLTDGFGPSQVWVRADLAHRLHLAQADALLLNQEVGNGEGELQAGRQRDRPQRAVGAIVTS
ncbi:hypothetical protein [Winogradskya humida]|uniref:hypothetical protein n=1 Tax=Winogradskya humida TaxID=113566 RepID=UPI001EF20F92|nr:hypothetical protein [Actinoplanes humidus]